MTTWRDVPGWEGLYAVSDDGQVKSLPRPVRNTERVLKQARETGARHYLYVTLWRGQRAHHKRVHTLVLEAFVGARSASGFGLHTDDDVTNNRLSNLRWGTRSENSRDMVANGNHNHARKTHCKHGHPFAGDNLVVTAKQRICRACARRRRAEYEARRALAVYAADIAEEV